jgi:uncharacterized membrane-anchored protein
MFKNIDKRYFGIILPLTILSVLIINAYSTTWFGHEIVLKASLDIKQKGFSGSYVELPYEIEEIDIADIIDGDTKKINRKINRYAVLKKNGDIYDLDYITKERPKGGIYLKCVLYRNYEPSSKTGIKANYNISKYYMKRGKTKFLEQFIDKKEMKVILKVKNGRGVVECIELI